MIPEYFKMLENVEKCHNPDLHWIWKFGILFFAAVAGIAAAMFLCWITQ